MNTLTMVRTECCEGYKTYGKRCSLCPNRPENRQALEAYRVAIRGFVSQNAPAACANTQFGGSQTGTAVVEATAAS